MFILQKSDENSKSCEDLRLMTTQEKSSLTGHEIFVVVFSHDKEDDFAKKKIWLSSKKFRD